MEFYWYILLIVIFINALFFFTSFGEYAKGLTANPDPMLIIFGLAFFAVLCTLFGFALVRVSK